MKKAGILTLAALCLMLSGCSAWPGREPVTENSIQAETMSSPRPDYGEMLRISELDLRNPAILMDDSGSFSDWVEIENISPNSVSLKNWTVSDKPKKRRQPISDQTLSSGERMVLFCGSFGLTEGETLYLIDPDGMVQDELLCELSEENLSVLAIQPDGSFAPTKWPSPGFPNDRAGFDAWSDSDLRTARLQINEVMVSNEKHPDTDGSLYDWVELKNMSEDVLELSGYRLSTGLEDQPRWQLPAVSLAPGELIQFACSEEYPPDEKNTGFSLNAVEETLYLTDPEEKTVDYIFLHDIPIEGSAGRLPGYGGFFYFTDPTPGLENRDGSRRVSDLPVSLTKEGSYNGVDSVSVQLAAAGEIHYTVDGSVPTAKSALYSGPIPLSRTGVIRAISLEENACQSRVATFSYFLNEGHTLPVLSLVVDDWGSFEHLYTFGIREQTIPANLALYGTDADFNRACEMSMKGWTSLSMQKKSMGVNFTGRYGGMLHCDLFGSGMTDYDELSLRVGQDFNFSVFRNELVQDLCLEASDSLYTQQSKFCVLYVNGLYYGIYCLKDDITRQFYANRTGVSVESVEGFRAPAVFESDYYNLMVDYGWHSDLSDPENYRMLNDGINLDSMIDWFLFEAYCGNTDTQGNLRAYRSPENGNRWEYVLYDLDWAFHYWQGGCRIILDQIGNVGSEMPHMLNNLLNNDSFREKLLRRFAQLMDTVFADDYVVDKIDRYEELLRPEIARDHTRWGLTEQLWTERVKLLRDTITENDYANYLIKDVCKRLNVTESEKEEYFGSRFPKE